MAHYLTVSGRKLQHPRTACKRGKKAKPDAVVHILSDSHCSRASSPAISCHFSRRLERETTGPRVTTLRALSSSTRCWMWSARKQSPAIACKVRASWPLHIPDTITHASASLCMAQAEACKGSRTFYLLLTSSTNLLEVFCVLPSQYMYGIKAVQALKGTAESCHGRCEKLVLCVVPV